jgi:hypothetical protein
MEQKDWKAILSRGNLSKFEIEELIEREIDSITYDCIVFIGFNKEFKKVGVKFHSEMYQDSLLKPLLELVSVNTSQLAVIRIMKGNGRANNVKKEELVANIIKEIAMGVGVDLAYTNTL